MIGETGVRGSGDGGGGFIPPRRTKGAASEKVGRESGSLPCRHSVQGEKSELVLA